VKELLPYIIERIHKSKTKYEVHSFDSGAIMVDIWIDDKFYVIQIDGDIIGLSLITQEAAPFDVIPDESFNDPNAFKTRFEDIFS